MSSDNPLISSVSRLVVFRTSLTKPTVNFAQSFHSSSGEILAHELVTALTNARYEVQTHLGTSDSPKPILDAIDNYLPLLWHFFSSLENQPPVKIDTPLIFEWKGAISINAIFCAYPDIIYEIIMVLHTKAILLSNYAAEILLSDIAASNQSGKCFREASGIMSYLSGHLIPRWQSSNIGKPLEVQSEMCRFLSSYFDACAHQMAIIKSMSINSPPAVLSGLCIAANFNMSCALDILNMNYSEEIRINNIDTNLQVHLGFMREYFMSLAYYYFAQDCIIKKETGQAIAMCTMALVSTYNHISYIYLCLYLYL